MASNRPTQNWLPDSGVIDSRLSYRARYSDGASPYPLSRCSLLDRSIAVRAVFCAHIAIIGWSPTAMAPESPRISGVSTGCAALSSLLIHPLLQAPHTSLTSCRYGGWFPRCRGSAFNGPA